ncbi:hypothetical protein HFN84_37470 [Rhizobium laguerreae]|uniref:hypothetical protein n=1 Tax=Rhizobium laguerreae TaxID=1076926 RepID=UPI001C90A961|nr:hypothetical protein [Rhizobium laguerreae]MBY3349181.1 hypothetical protein [Rhizobium laguerreae]MBY3377322.1 hypothetical protein [Rhizobium laguerreae]MBY3404734.1 hypothetical protein [Rhizobium laguerreae]MBY3432552.1 hypothetical protein [Rhizobium laguerreae]MBY3441064.1 hypothetical protein [Rhizobium laguerreae]
MVNRTREVAAVRYLMDVMRSRTPAYIPDGSIENELEWPQPVAGRSLKDALEIRIDRLLSQTIPATPAYNKQRLYALNSIHQATLGEMTTNTDGNELHRLIDTIYARRPQLPTVVSTDVAAALHKKLRQYTKINGGDPREFPYIEILGHRRDELQLHKYDENFSGGTPRNPSLKRATLREINALLDQTVPDGAFFNGLRQAVVDEICESGENLSRWAQRESEIAETRAKTGEIGFIPNSYHYAKARAVSALGEKIVPWRAELRPQQRLAPETAIAIAKLIQQHCDLTRQHGDNRFFLPKQLPKGIKDSIRRASPQRARTVRVAKEMATRVLDAMDAVIGPRRGNFASRAWFLKTASEHREYWLEPNSNSTALAEHSPTLLPLVNRYSRTLNSKSLEMGRLVRTIEDYHQAWQGRLRELPDNHMPHRLAVSVRSTRLDLDNSKAMFELAKAANMPGQQKLKLAHRNESEEMAPAGDRAGSTSTERKAATPSMQESSCSGSYYVKEDIEIGKLLNGRKRPRDVEERERGNSMSR